MNPLSRWAHYTLPTGKQGADETGIPRALRGISDTRGINAATEDVDCEHPDGFAELERVSSPSRYRLSTDALSAFTAFPLSDTAADVFTTWLPNGPSRADGYSKFAQSRMLFGYKNAPRIQGAYYNAVRNKLKPQTRAMVSLFVDDAHTGSIWQSDARAEFQEWRDACDDLFFQFGEANVLFAPPKTSFGKKRVAFYGFEVNYDGACSISEENTAAIRNMAFPRDKPGMRAALGFFGFVRGWCRNYAHVAATLFDLTKDDVDYERDCTDDHRRVFEELKDLLVTATATYRPRPDLQLCLEVDASFLAIGVRCYQVTEEGDEHNVAFWSRRLTPAEQKLSANLRETIGLVYGLKKARLYALSSRHAVLAYTDHQSLRHMTLNSKGSLSAQHFAEISDIDYILRWLPGEQNTAADFLSRFPTSGWHEFTTLGLGEAVKDVLRRLGDQHRGDQRVWVYSHTDAEHVEGLVQDWRHVKRGVVRGSTVGTTMSDGNWTFAVLVPSPLTAAKDAAALFNSGKAGVVLVPQDLVVSIVERGGKYDTELGVKLRQAAKISFPIADYIFLGVGVQFADAVCLAMTARRAGCGAGRSAEAAPVETRGSRRRAAVTGPTPADFDRARRDAAAMQVWELELELRKRGLQHRGLRRVLVERLVPALAGEVHQAVSGGWRGRDRDRLHTQRSSAVAGADSAGGGGSGDVQGAAINTVVDVSANTTHGSRGGAAAVNVTSVLEAVVAAIGSTKLWPARQVAADVPPVNRMIRDDGMVMYADTGRRPRVLVPNQYRRHVMELTHLETGHNVRGGHTHLAAFFWWPRMAADFEAYRRSCPGCLRSRRYIRHMHGLFRCQSLFLPGRHWAADLKKMGADADARQVLGLIDRFSSYAVLIEVPDKSSASIIAGMMVHLQFVHGAPASLAVDADSPFVSEEFRGWCDRHRIRLIEPLPYNHTGHGAAESFWRHVQQGVRIAPRFPGGQELLSQLAHQWNVTVHATTGMAPYTIQFGRPPYTLAQRVVEEELGDDDLRVLAASEVPDSAFVDELSRGAAAARRVAAARGNDARRATAVALNARAHGRLGELAIGTEVYYYLPPSGSRVDAAGQKRNADFRPLFSGPGVVRRRLSHVGYVVEDLATGREFYRHRQHLRPAADPESDTDGKDSPAGKPTSSGTTEAAERAMGRYGEPGPELFHAGFAGVGSTVALGNGAEAQ